MIRRELFKGLVVVVGVVVCLSLVCVVLCLNNGLFSNGVSEGDLIVSDEVFSESVFPLEVELSSTVFNVGDKISGTATVINKSGKDIKYVTNVKYIMPCVYFHDINYTRGYIETTGRVYYNFKADDKKSNVFVYDAMESGTYILHVHYWMEINGHEIRSEKNITIAIK
jgi:hypothetical protein